MALCLWADFGNIVITSIDSLLPAILSNVPLTGRPFHHQTAPLPAWGNTISGAGNELPIDTNWSFSNILASR